MEREEQPGTSERKVLIPAWRLRSVCFGGWIAQVSSASSCLRGAAVWMLALWIGANGAYELHRLHAGERIGS